MNNSEDFEENFKQICDLVRNLREQKKKVNVRYQILYVCVQEDFDEHYIDRWESEILDECNVKHLIVIPHSRIKGKGEIVLDFRKIGKRIPKKVKLISKNKKFFTEDYTFFGKIKKFFGMNAEKVVKVSGSSLLKNEYVISIKPDKGIFLKNDKITVILENEVEDFFELRKKIKTIQKDTFHEIKIALGGWEDEIIGAYDPRVKDFFQWAMDRFDFKSLDYLIYKI